jgi:hypothetical protein
VPVAAASEPDVVVVEENVVAPEGDAAVTAPAPAAKSNPLFQKKVRA